VFGKRRHSFSDAQACLPWMRFPVNLESFDDATVAVPRAGAARSLFDSLPTTLASPTLAD
jgi:hypothetical protein